jgi:hypothetical protein
MEGVEYSAYPSANALVANDMPTIAPVALAEPGRPNSRTDEVMVTSEIGRLCCKNRKLQGSRFFAKTLRSERPLIRMTSIALPKSPVSFA